MDEAQLALKRRYPNLHPVLFQRSVERARSNGELFDILEDVSTIDFPIIWDEIGRKWTRTDDLLQSEILLSDKKE
jgi:hypothetical protein